jgi:energy-coupling factor transporter ATP-binding protein EcfA2
MSDPLIRCAGLVHVYPDGTRALDGIDLEIAAGERVALTGPNGSGKTTLVRHWNGLLRPTAGIVTIGGRSTEGRHVAELAREVGIAFQDPSAQLFASTCRGEVAFGARNAGDRGRNLEAIVDESLDRVGLLDRAASNPYDLGSSKRRLLTIAAVLAMRPRVIVLDEPTIGLDAAEVGLVRHAVEGEAARGSTIVAISHDPRFLAGTFGRVLVLEAGRVVTDETCEP